MSDQAKPMRTSEPISDAPQPTMITAKAKHIEVCICTYKRPELLKRLLQALDGQQTSGAFTYSILVIDNDQSRSAETVVLEFASTSTTAIRYFLESRQNIATARNKAVENATGDFIAFIDDDEFPIPNWLLILFEAYQKYEVEGVLGPVKPYFDKEAPRWVVRGKFYNRPTYPTGFVINWRKGRTGNVLLKRMLFTAGDPPFNPKFRNGEDQDFFRRMINKGHVFIWCDEAVAYETVPPIRWRRTIMLKRALLRGASAALHPVGALGIAKSLIAVPVYTVALPFALVVGHHRFMILLIRICDHLGKLLGLMGINVIKEQYVTE